VGKEPKSRPAGKDRRWWSVLVGTCERQWDVLERRGAPWEFGGRLTGSMWPQGFGHEDVVDELERRP
jgi:hypothetical protein